MYQGMSSCETIHACAVTAKSSRSAGPIIGRIFSQVQAQTERLVVVVLWSLERFAKYVQCK